MEQSIIGMCAVVVRREAVDADSSAINSTIAFVLVGGQIHPLLCETQKAGDSFGILQHTKREHGALLDY